jgi:hypothetical protein
VSRQQHAKGSALPRAGLRGWREADGGYEPFVEVPPVWRGSTAAIGGLRPWPTSSPVPGTGVPLGPALDPTRAIVCADPISWFERAHLIGNPSAFVLGRPGLGKSTLVRRLALGLAAGGVTPLVLGDLKPDYTGLVAALGGQVIRLGRGQGTLNVLDPGQMSQAASRLTGSSARAIRDDAHHRRLTMVLALLAITRPQPLRDVERTAIVVALQELANRHSGGRAPDLTDLVAILMQPTPAMVTRTLAPNAPTFRAQQLNLLHAVRHLVESPIGSMLAGPTTTDLDLRSPALAVDISAIPADPDAQAAVLLAVWAEGFGAVEAANALTDAGLAPQRRFLLILDELWRALRAGAGMVDRLDALTRLNRAHGVGQVMITHSLKDLDALPDPADRAKATGFVDRAGMLFLGGLPDIELEGVARVSALTRAEARLLTSWSSPPDLTARTDPPGVGHFLLKVGDRPGVPFRLRLTEAERVAGIHDTNQRWAAA